jgi:hypothetical protein
MPIEVTMLLPVLLLAGIGGVAYFALRQKPKTTSTTTAPPAPATGGPPEGRPPPPPIPAPPPDAIMGAASMAPTQPLYTVTMLIKNAVYEDLYETFAFRNEGSAEMYYSVLKMFFDDPYVYKAYTYPSGTIMVNKMGTPPSVSRVAMYNENGPMAV